MTPDARFKNAARQKARYAVRKGTLVPQPCEVCGRTPVQGHHEDYYKPLEVRWLCPLHHSHVHVYGDTIEGMRHYLEENGIPEYYPAYGKEAA